MQTLILDAAGCEFVKRVMKLYGSARFSSARGKIADTLFESAVEAGNLTASVVSCNNADERRKVAAKALEAMNKTTFCLKVAEETGVLSPHRTKPVSDFAEEIKAALAPYVRGRNVPFDGRGDGQDTDGFNDDYIG